MGWIASAILSCVFWGTGDVLGVSVSRKMGGPSVTTWAAIFALILFLPYAATQTGLLSGLGWQHLLVIAVLGIIWTIGNVCFNEGLRLSNAPAVGTIAAGYTTVTVLLSVLFLGEQLTLIQAATIALVYIGIALASLRAGPSGLTFRDRGVVLALIAMVCWGVFFAFLKPVVRAVGWFWPFYLILFLFPLIMLFQRLRRQPLVSPFRTGAWRLLLPMVLLLRSADFSFNYGISVGDISVVAPVAGSYPILFVLVSSLIYRDPVSKRQWTGIAAALVGIVFLLIVSS